MWPFSELSLPTRRRQRVLTRELAQATRPLRPAYAALLEPRGYVFKRRLAQDDFFVRRQRCPSSSPSTPTATDPAQPRPRAPPPALATAATAWQHAGCPTVRVQEPKAACRRTDAAVGAVRCCGALAAEGGTRACYSVCYAHQRPYSRSRWELPPLVVRNALRANFSGAVAECAAYGMRLCSRAELAGGACCKSGCGMDAKPVWTAEVGCAL